MLVRQIICFCSRLKFSLLSTSDSPPQYYCSVFISYLRCNCSSMFKIMNTDSIITFSLSFCLNLDTNFEFFFHNNRVLHKTLSRPWCGSRPEVGNHYLRDVLRNTSEVTQNWLLEWPRCRLNVTPSETALSFDCDTHADREALLPLCAKHRVELRKERLYMSASREMLWGPRVFRVDKAPVIASTPPLDCVRHDDTALHLVVSQQIDRAPCCATSATSPTRVSRL